jgi:hypothetical protein
MALLQKIRTLSRRLVQLEGGTGNNQPARASDVNPIIDWVNNRSDVTTAANTATSASAAATLNALSGTITTESLTTAAVTTATLTVTDAYCTASSTVLVQIAGGSYTTGEPVVIKVVPSAGSFVISFRNVHATNALNGTLIFKFIIL